jgi:hypothetical protein
VLVRLVTTCSLRVSKRNRLISDVITADAVAGSWIARWRNARLEGALVLVLFTRLVPLVAAPLTLYLVATRWPADEQGFYFILVNVQALASLIELGAGSIVVQFVSHESPLLVWGPRGALEGDANAVARVMSVVHEGWRWYGGAALVLLLALPAGLAAWGAQARSDVGFTAAWAVVVVSTACYLPLIPLLCTIEGMRGLRQVQRMRLAQAVTGVGALWLGLLTRGALFGVGLLSVLWVVIAATWLVATHGALVRQTITSAGKGGAPRDLALGAVQWRTGFSWLAFWLAPQALAPLVLAMAGAADAGRVGMSLAIATAPNTLSGAWLQSRLPQFASTLAADGRDALNALAMRAARDALFVCCAAGLAIVGAAAIIHAYRPALGARLLPVGAVAALCATGVAWVTIQALTGYLRADREEPLFGVMAAGVGTTVLVAALAAPFGGVVTAYAYSATVLLVVLPLAGSGFRRALSRRRSV